MFSSGSCIRWVGAMVSSPASWPRSYAAWIAVGQRQLQRVRTPAQIGGEQRTRLSRGLVREQPGGAGDETARVGEGGGGVEVGAHAATESGGRAGLDHDPGVVAFTEAERDLGVGLRHRRHRGAAPSARLEDDLLEEGEEEVEGEPVEVLIGPPRELGEVEPDRQPPARRGLGVGGGFEQKAEAVERVRAYLGAGLEAGGRGCEAGAAGREEESERGIDVGERGRARLEAEAVTRLRLERDAELPPGPGPAGDDAFIAGIGAE